MESIFKSKEENLGVEDKSAAFARLTAKFSQSLVLPKRAPLCALFVGNVGTGKSATANSYAKLLGPGEKVLYIDLESGNKENLIEYWQKDADKFIYDYPVVWEQDDNKKDRRSYINYDKTISELRLRGMWLEAYAEEFKIRAVILDGLKKLKDYAEYQMKNEQNISIGGAPERKYWRVRNVDMIETMESFKILPIDTIFIGSMDFNRAPEDQGGIDRDIDNLISQKVLFKKEVIGEQTQFVAKILKSRQKFESNQREITFGELDPENDKAYLDGTKVLDALISDRGKE